MMNATERGSSVPYLKALFTGGPLRSHSDTGQDNEDVSPLQRRLAMFRGNLWLALESFGVVFAYGAVIAVLLYPVLSAARFIS